MATSSLRESVLEDGAALLKEGLDRDDHLELAALGQEPLAALEHSILASEVALTIEIDGKVASVAGVVRRAWGGQFWFLTSWLAQKHPRAFLRSADLAFDILSSGQPEMGNVVDARHRRALRLACHYGFELGRPIEHGVHGELFVPILWRPKGVAHVYGA